MINLKIVMPILILFNLNIFAEISPDSQLAFADYLAEKKEHSFSILEYSRYKNILGANTAFADYKLGKIWQEIGNFPKASEFFENVINTENDSSQIKVKAHIKLIKNCILQNNLSLARFEINQLRNYTNKKHENELFFLEALTYAHEYKLDSTKINILKSDSIYKSKINKLEMTFAKYKKQKFKNPKIAYSLGIIPGMGHYYTGDKKQATGAFLLVNSLMSVMAWNTYKLITCENKQEKYIASMDLLVVGGFLWKRYYDGSRKNAFESAIRYNRNIQIEYQDNLRKIGGF